MSENKMKEVAQLLGLELEEEFEIGKFGRYKFTVNGLMFWSKYRQAWVHLDRIEQLLLRRYEIVKLPKQILDDVEKEYLSNIIKPFRKKVNYIIKDNTDFNDNYEYISIAYCDSTGDCMLSFPDFKVGTMYRGMKIGKPYTLAELGL